MPVNFDFKDNTAVFSQQQPAFSQQANAFTFNTPANQFSSGQQQPPAPEKGFFAKTVGGILQGFTDIKGGIQGLKEDVGLGDVKGTTAGMTPPQLPQMNNQIVQLPQTQNSTQSYMEYMKRRGLL